MRAAVLLPLLLAGCGAARELKPRAGETLPVAPYGAAARPSRDQLIRPTTQQRPARTDELLTASDARRRDEFDLPPGEPVPPMPPAGVAPDAAPRRRGAPGSPSAAPR